MISRDYIEKFLRLNGLEPSASDEEIKSVLVSAKWHEDDAELALMVLRENKETHKERVDTLHKVFTSDDRLSPETISALLGIDMELNSSELESLKAKKQRVSLLQAASIISMATVLAAASVIGFMWQNSIGPFFTLQ